MGPAPEKDHPNLPLLSNLVKNEDKPIVTFMSSLISIGRSLTVPNAVPSDRKKFLRAAFADMAQDPNFAADMKKRKLEVTYTSAADVHKVVNESLAMSADVINRTAVALLPGFSPDLALATLPAATVVTGMALSAWVSSIVTRRTGRQRGFLIGTGLAVISGAACFSSVVYMNFWLLALGGLIFGFFAGFATLYRFAVADGISDKNRSIAISLVLAGGVFSGFAGAGLAIWGGF